MPEQEVLSGSFLSFCRLPANEAGVREWGVRVSGPLALRGQSLGGRRVSVLTRSTGELVEKVLVERVGTSFMSRGQWVALYTVEAPQNEPGTVVAPEQRGEDLTPPSDRNRTGRMLLAGGVTATVTLPSGEHVTLRMQTWRPNPEGGRWVRATIGEEGARMTVKVGRGDGLRVGRVYAGWNIVWDSAVPTSVQVKDAVRNLFTYAGRIDDPVALLELWGAYRIQVEDRCGRCRRELTDPESIDRGIGPECYGRSTGSTHAPIVEDSAPSPSSSDWVDLAERVTVNSLDLQPGDQFVGRLSGRICTIQEDGSCSWEGDDPRRYSTSLYSTRRFLRRGSPVLSRTGRRRVSTVVDEAVTTPSVVVIATRVEDEADEQARDEQAAAAATAISGLEVEAVIVDEVATQVVEAPDGTRALSAYPDDDERVVGSVGDLIAASGSTVDVDVESPATPAPPMPMTIRAFTEYLLDCGNRGQQLPEALAGLGIGIDETTPIHEIMIPVYRPESGSS